MYKTAVTLSRRIHSPYKIYIICSIPTGWSIWDAIITLYLIFDAVTRLIIIPLTLDFPLYWGPCRRTVISLIKG